MALHFELATPMRPMVSADVDEVVAPGSEGYFGVLPGHAPFLTTLGTGEVMYRVGHDERWIMVSGGFAEVGADRVIILAEIADLPEEIDRARAEQARQRAEQRLAGRSPRHMIEEIDYARAVAALARALARLQVAGRVARAA
jgi:F-type H+-transporting ATPase subunit epsilon